MTRNPLLPPSPTLDRIDLNLFVVFDVIYRERNLTRSAEVLSLSQSAVSHALSRMRQRLGDALFLRQGRGVVPTPRAEALAPQVQAALARLRAALEPGRGFEPAHDLRRLSLAMPDELEPIVLPALLAALRTAAPAAVIASLRLDRPALRTDLAAGRIDLAIDVPRSVDAEVLHAPLIRHRFCVVAARRLRLSAARYLAAEHVAVSSRRTGHTFEDFVLDRMGMRRRLALRCQNYEAACRVVAGSDLLLTMPRRHAELLRPALGFHILALPLEMPGIDLHLYWHRQADGLPSSQWLRQCVRDVLSAREG